MIEINYKKFLEYARKCNTKFPLLYNEDRYKKDKNYFDIAKTRLGN